MSSFSLRITPRGPLPEDRLRSFLEAYSPINTRTAGSQIHVWFSDSQSMERFCEDCRGGKQQMFKDASLEILRSKQSISLLSSEQNSHSITSIHDLEMDERKEGFCEQIVIDEAGDESQQFIEAYGGLPLEGPHEAFSMSEQRKHCFIVLDEEQIDQPSPPAEQQKTRYFDVPERKQEQLPTPQSEEQLPTPQSEEQLPTPSSGEENACCTVEQPLREQQTAALGRNMPDSLFWLLALLFVIFLL